MRHFWAFLALLAAILVLPQCCRPAQSPDRTAFVDGLIHKTVALVHFVIDEVDPSTSATMQPYCSGVWVSEDRILTAYHCIEDLHGPNYVPPSAEAVPQGILQLFGLSTPENDPTGAEVLYAGRDDIKTDAPGIHFDYWRGKVLKGDKFHDLAVILVNKEHPKHESASVAWGAAVGEEINIIGHPAGAMWTYEHGYVAAFRPDHPSPDGSKKSMTMIQVEAPIWFGNSGGPAFNQRGEIVGITSQLRRGVPEMGFFVPFSAIRSFL